MLNTITPLEREQYQAHIARRMRMMRPLPKPTRPPIVVEPPMVHPTLETMLVIYPHSKPSLQLRSMFDTDQRPIPTISFIVAFLCEHYHVTRAELFGCRRLKQICHVRHIGYWLAKQITGKSLPYIGAKFGGRDHTSIMHGARKIEIKRQTDSDLVEETDAVKSLLMNAWAGQ